MPKLDHTGPEGAGPATGRKLGRCNKKGEKPADARLGKGMGKRRNEGCGEGKGKRLRSNLPD
jgi:hypothetical protein